MEKFVRNAATAILMILAKFAMMAQTQPAKLIAQGALTIHGSLTAKFAKNVEMEI